MSSIEALFSDLISATNAAPYSYQLRCAQAIQQGKNVIVCAPTGSGKTWAALLGYLHSRQIGQPFVDRVFYVLPMRTLANSLYRSVQDSCKQVFDVTSLPEEKRYHPSKLAVTIQTGERKADPFFEGDIIFTTIDQLLAGYLNIPLSLPAKLSNINAGALLGSLVVLDEIHLLDPSRSLATIVEMAERLALYVQFVVMTATMSSNAVQALQQHLSAEVITVSAEELAIMPSHKDKRRRYVWTGSPVTAAQVLTHHNNGRTIVICNTVARAQGLYRDLKDVLHPGCQLFLLHSRFLKQDRQAVEGQLMRYFGPNAQETNAILVTTQVVEAGVDISADNLHTELCPANALIQRAGRAARYPFPRNTGTVWVYEPEVDQQGRYRLGPYRDRLSAAAIERTRQAIAAQNGNILGFAEEQALVDLVHGKAESEVFTAIFADNARRRREVSQAIDTADRSKIVDLIRHVDSIGVIITDTPETIDLSRLPELLSVPRTSLYSAFNTMTGCGAPGEWFAKIPRIKETDGQVTTVEWHALTVGNELKMAEWLIAISPRFARYTADIGLELGVPGPVPQVPANEIQPWTPYHFEYEPFKDHVIKVVEEARHEAKRSICARYRLERHLGLPPRFAEHLVEITCALHDTGKLLKQWQQAALDWQQRFYPEQIVEEGSPVAHTTFRPEAGDIEKQRLMHLTRGPHAAEGAFAVSKALGRYFDKHFHDEEIIGGIWKAILTAIARHHSSQTQTVGRKLSFIADAASCLNAAVLAAGLDIMVDELIVPIQERDGENFKRALISAEEHYVWLPLYWFLVRRLRLADQYATKMTGG